MKATIQVFSFIILFFFKLCSQETAYNDWKRNALIGKIKSVKKEEFEASRIKGMLVVDKKNLSSYSIDYYNKNGSFVKTISKALDEPKETYVAKYDKNNVPISYSKYLNDTNLIEFSKNVEFGNGHSINYVQILQSTDSNTIEMWFNNKFRDSFAILENFKYGKLKSKVEITFVYDTNFLEIENKYKTTVFFMNGEIDKIEYSSTKYNYILFDEKGNWVGREVIEVLPDENAELTMSYVKRSIEYYK